MLEQQPSGEPDPDEYVPDDLLRLIFIACHPVLRTEGRVALTLRLLGGLSTAEIARAFLVPEPTVGQRDLPGQADPARAGRPVRAAAAGRAAAAAGQRPRGRLPDLQRGLHGDRRRRLDPPGAVRGRAAAGPAAGRPAAGPARGARPARAAGDPGVPAAGPHRTGRRAGAAARPGPPALGPAADPPRAGRAGPGAGPRRRLRPVRAAGGDRGRARPGGDRGRDRLAAGSPRSTGCSSRCRRRRWPSSTGPSRSAGPAARPPGWPSPTRCAAEKALARYPHLPAVRADLLEQLGRTAEAAAEFARAAELTANERERALFLARAEAATAR